MKLAFLPHGRGFLAASLFVPALAHAHAAAAGAAHPFLSGAIHPLTGLDHTCAMLAVGLWAAQLGGRAVWALPLAFVAALLAGGALGMGGFPLPLVEPAILGSLLLLGLALVSGSRWNVVAAATLVAGFGLFHGHAHGLEKPPAASAGAYASGFALMSVLLHVAGLGLGRWLRRTSASHHLLRWAGAAVLACALLA